MVVSSVLSVITRLVIRVKEGRERFVRWVLVSEMLFNV